jgi:D-sedoheptulose 7-phosphate isomerase
VSGAPKSRAAELYPFLAPSSAASDNVVEDARRSTVAKMRETVELRERVHREVGAGLCACACAMARAFAAGGRLFVFGNGGSATDAHAMAALHVHPPTGRALPAMALSSDVAVVTALANDVGFDVVYARQIAARAAAADIALGLSTSGNSENVLRAFEEAHRRGLLTVGLAGYEGGRMAETTSIDHLLVVPSASVHRIQEAQTTVYHVLWELTQVALDAMLAAVRGPGATGS